MSAFPVPALHGTRPAPSTPGSRPYPDQHALDMLDRGFRHDAMAEIEDVRASEHGRKDHVDALLQGRAASHEGERVEIALRGEARRQTGQHRRGIEGPIEGDAI